MKNEKLINTIKSKIESLVEKRRADIKNVETAILTAKEGISVANKQMDEATFNSNKTAYKKARDEKAEHELSLEMFEKRMEQIKGAELITEADSVAVDDSIVKAQDELKDEMLTMVRPILADLFKLYGDYRSEINALDSVRRDWRERAWKKQKQIGRNMFEIDLPKQYDDGGLSDFLNSIRGSYFVTNTYGFEKEDTRTGIQKMLSR